MNTRVEAGKRIVDKLNDVLDNELLEDIFPALCWTVGTLGTEVKASKDDFMNMVIRAVSSSYDINLTEDDDATTH